MLFFMIRLLSGFSSGCLFMIWLPVSFPAEPGAALAQLLLSPGEFLAAAFAFSISFMSFASCLNAVLESGRRFEGRSASGFAAVCGIGALLVCFLALFFMGFWKGFLLFIFSFLYGIISIDFYRKR
ncbi:hypothetical protein [Bacillus infantis]|uniref:hypothetical protein n=1 Tax=Bacillus infantis TaxID=324767 RepID=UPI00101CADE0|nr:hypothetical protein [Bacillus infantis]MCR6611809.1 hypothetical protein [Bacillus infantis]RYI31288.1 hypothetical protein EVU96_04555 [Bacillus infantis]